MDTVMISISFGITAHNEHKELSELLALLDKHVKEQDEIVVLLDENSYTDKVVEVCMGWGITPEYNSLNQNFAQHKNYLNDLCTKDYIFQIDADEMPNELLLINLHDIVEENDVDLMWVPRINTVEGITQLHIKNWGWRRNESGWINFPDYQGRIYRNKEGVRWDGRVHEQITGYDDYTRLPAYEELSLYHHKSIDKQEKQNKMYNKIQK